jgi:hypothetical protein
MTLRRVSDSSYRVIAGRAAIAMPPAVSAIANRLGATDLVVRNGYLRVALLGVLHAVALVIMLATEVAIVPKLVFLLTWGALNFFWLAALRRPIVSAGLSLMIIAVLILVSRLKYDMIWMTANFLDVMIIDADSIKFLMSVMPSLARNIMIGAAAVGGVTALLWYFDRLRFERQTASYGFSACFLGVAALSLAVPQEEWEAFFGDSYVSKFLRSGVSAVVELSLHGYMASDPSTGERLRPMAEFSCAPTARPPHILLVHDESSFDLRAAPGVTVPAGYGAHFRSFDGRQRKFVVEGAGGPSWYTEYNVLAGLSARSYGRFSYFVTQIAAGHVERGLPNALQRCGYQTFSIFPALGAFMGARAFQKSVGVETFYDSNDLGTNRIEPDSFYYDAALRTIAKEHDKAPLFLFVYLAQNHYPWNHRWRPDLNPEWKDLGNRPGLDEYLRRQSLSARDYASLLERLRRDFPGEKFLLVRYGDHQPDFASTILEPALDENGINQRLIDFDQRYFTTYYAIDAVNYKPADLSSALATLEGPYLPLVVQEAAGLPLDPSFAEQKRILLRCNGQFYLCGGGTEARRFNRLLIDAGLIKGL